MISPVRCRAAAGNALAALAVAACATATFDAGEPKSVTGDTLPPFGFREECARLVPSDRLDYSFAASEPVAFEIRYRAGNAVLAPLTREATRGDVGRFAPPVAEDYCLRWEAGPAGTVLDFRIRLWRAGS
jgi:hypothetical protein